MATPKPLRVLKLVDRSNQPEVTLGKLGNTYCLYMAHPRKDGSFETPIYCILSCILNEDPFPGFSAGGNEMIWVKNYSENEGMLEILEKAGWLRNSGRTLKQGFVTYPLCEVRLEESEIARQCPTCGSNERVGDASRYSRCSSCKKVYYCSSECQLEDWKAHKVICKQLKAGKLAEVENNARKENEKAMRDMGWQTADF